RARDLVFAWQTVCHAFAALSAPACGTCDPKGRESMPCNAVNKFRGCFVSKSLPAMTSGCFLPQLPRGRPGRISDAGRAAERAVSRQNGCCHAHHSGETAHDQVARFVPRGVVPVSHARALETSP